MLKQYFKQVLSSEINYYPDVDGSSVDYNPYTIIALKYCTDILTNTCIDIIFFTLYILLK